jgi:acyl carrier protein
MQPNIAEQIHRFVVNTFLFGQPDRLRNEDSFLAEGIIDSTGVLELVSHVEEQYGIEVQDHELIPENFDSISRLTTYVQTKLNGRAATM